MNRPQEKPALGKKYSVLLADDDPIVREVVRTKLSGSREFEVIGEASDGKSTVEQVEKLHPDVLLLDLLMPNLPGIDALQELSARNAKAHTIVFSASVGPQQIVQALQLGARGILSKKSIAQLESAIRCVLEGKYWVEGREEASVAKLLAGLSASIGVEAKPRNFGLTTREIGVIALVTEGCSNREIAARLNITEDTVKRHLTNIFDKVGMSTRLELALFALKNRLASTRGA
ncbi:MAG: DNA-binding response regulator [Acidobacteria bacterium]|nr:MAG: DNA-binding response regulator [Acidobacteriota bacterium]